MEEKELKKEEKNQRKSVVNDIKSLTIYNEYFKLINTLKPIKKRDEFIGKIFDYYFKDIEPIFGVDSDEEAIWGNISKPIKRYKTQALNGSKGGRPSTKTKSQKETQTESETETQNITQAETTSNDVIVLVNVNKENISKRTKLEVIEDTCEDRDRGMGEEKETKVNILEIMQENFGRTFNSLEVEEMSTWEETELTVYAIKQAVLNNVRSLKYISRILESYKLKGIKTIAEAQADEKEFKKKNRKKETQKEMFERMQREGKI